MDDRPSGSHPASSPLTAFLGGPLPLVLAAVAAWGCMTVPPEVPGALPSRVAEPPSAAYREAVEEGRAIARTLISEERLPGLSLAVAVDGEIVWAEGFGRADLESQAPVTPATLLRIGGVSQTITAAAVGLLSERGRLDLDAPVQRYVPGFPQKEWPISTRQLMSHTAGVRHYHGEEEVFGQAACGDDVQRLAIFAEDRLRFRPGTKSAYSTFGWVLVGAVVAGAAGEPYLDFVQREILTPLGMESTMADIASRAEPGSAHFYYPSVMLNPRHGLQDAPEVDLSCILPAGGFLSTPSDLARFGSAMMGDALLQAATVAELQTPVRLASGESTGQALGWVVRYVPAGPGASPTRIVGQGLGDAVRRSFLSAVTLGGHVSGGTAALATVPEHRIAIAVASNVSGAESVPLLSTRLSDVFVRLQEGRREASGKEQGRAHLLPPRG
ncbi:MAG TPA: serine hydrolase domain-containing protein [Candidatus Polarisedimenticolia bacterium]|nr:serine hydrolase domain-containing protein [Candidatus Polarisedimenticolia bacterium]